jgi:integrase
MQAARQGDDSNAYVFPGPQRGKPLSNMAFLMLLRRMEPEDLTVHGFRATFKTWTSERTSLQNEIAEAALAHIIGDKVEQAYRRGDLFDKRRRLMQQWATFCTTAPAQEQQRNVTPLR